MAEESSVSDENQNFNSSELSGFNSKVNCDDGDNEWPIERQLEEGRRIFYMAANNKYMEAHSMLKENASKSLVHSYGLAWIMTVRAVLYMKRNTENKVFDDAFKCAAKAFSTIEKKRKKRNWSSMLKIDYNTFTDEQCHAELIYGEINAMSAALNVVYEPSFVAFVKAAYRMRCCYQSFNECNRILQTKTNWSSRSNRDNFEAGVLLGLGLFEIGFSSDRWNGMHKLLQAAKLKETVRYLAIAVALSILNGFGEYFYGIGEPNIDCLKDAMDFCTAHAPDSTFKSLGEAFVEQNKGNYSKACEHYVKFASGQSVFKSLNYMSNWQHIWIYAVQWDWANAAANAKFMVDKCPWSPAMFSYIYATCLVMQSEEETDREKAASLKELATDAFEKVNKLKRNFGGSRAFHEKLVTYNAKKFLANPESAVYPIFELLYLWNGFQVASCNSDCLAYILTKIESKLKKHSDSIELTADLTFMRGMCFAHHKRPMMAMDCFLEVIGYEEKLLELNHLVSQSCFEVALLYRHTGDYEQARSWLKKAATYDGYITDSLIKFRINYVHNLIKQ